MDNAQIHHGLQIPELCDRFGEWFFGAAFLIAHWFAGVHVEYLPSYLPNLDPIEEAYSSRV
jgi:hypothetical protein